MPARILLVDDEPAIRDTLSRILKLHSFEVTCCALVAEALSQVASREFDVLISDLNVGEPGDGFTIVSAMRRTQPRCITLILTGYPAFETALEAIRSQVDDYLVKPVGIFDIVNTIESKLRFRDQNGERRIATKRISELIPENISTIIQRTLAAIKAEPELGALPLTDEQFTFPFVPLLKELAGMLASAEPDRVSSQALRSAAMGGHIRRLQGYSIPLIIATLRLLENTVLDVIDENLLVLDVSHLIRDMRRLSNSLVLQLQETTKAFLQTSERELRFEGSGNWTGWFCARCCWNRPQPPSVREQATLSSRIRAEFLAHNCEAFARQNWKLPA